MQNSQIYKIDFIKDLHSQLLELVYNQSKTTLSDAVIQPLKLKFKIRTKANIA